MKARTILTGAADAFGDACLALKACADERLRPGLLARHRAAEVALKSAARLYANGTRKHRIPGEPA